MTGRIADDEQPMVMARFSTPFTRCTNAGTTLKKRHFAPLFGPPWATSTRQGSLRKPLRSQQIGTEMSRSGRSEKLVAQASRKRHFNVR